jgi:hypothetical protein
VSVRRRIEKYRSSGGAADLVKVEVLVPPSARADVLRLAARLRSEHRDSRELRKLCERALRCMARAFWTMSISTAFPISARAQPSLRGR